MHSPKWREWAIRMLIIYPAYIYDLWLITSCLTGAKHLFVTSSNFVGIILNNFINIIYYTQLETTNHIDVMRRFFYFLSLFFLAVWE